MDYRELPVETGHNVGFSGRSARSGAADCYEPHLVRKGSRKWKVTRTSKTNPPRTMTPKIILAAGVRLTKNLPPAKRFPTNSKRSKVGGSA